jgi:hypothetical protein
LIAGFCALGDVSSLSPDKTLPKPADSAPHGMP